LGYFFPSLSTFLSEIEFANVSLPIAVVLLMMMYLIMLKVKYSELLNIKKNAKVIGFTLTLNWAVQPFTMAIIAWFFMTIIFSYIIPEKLQKEYTMGMIILGLVFTFHLLSIFTTSFPYRYLFISWRHDTQCM